MTGQEIRVKNGIHHKDVLNYIEKIFKLYYRGLESNNSRLKYQLIDTDIDLEIDIYEDKFIRRIYFCTWSDGWEHKQKSLCIDYNHRGYFQEFIGRTGLYRNIGNKQNAFKEIDKYFNLVCSGIVRDKKLSKILG